MRFSGENGAKKEVDGEGGSCHKRFRTMAQAEAFIEDWKETYAEIWREIIKEALDQGYRPLKSDAFRPHKMRSMIKVLFCDASECSEVDDLTEKTKSQLSLQDNSKKDKKTI
jgi:viroplasmin and RNaseH domain-containing protein